MNTQSDQDNPHEKIELRIRTMRVLWLALLFSIVSYYMLTVFVGRNEGATPNNALSLTLLAVAFSTTVAALLVKNKLLARAIEQRQVGMVQQAYVVAWAINEMAALLGVVDFFLTGNRYYFAPFLIALVGDLLQFPRREHVENAAFKGTTF